MRRVFIFILSSIVMLTMPACSIFGNLDTQIAPYAVSRSDGIFEIRQYKELVLVSTPMGNEMDDSRDAFQKLFRYISGENKGTAEIDMTAPVLMDSGDSEGQKIAMTAPVIMDQAENDENWTMYFVLPDRFTFESAPRPTDPQVTLSRITDLKVAAVTFSGLLSRANVQRYRSRLEKWIVSNDYEIIGPYKTAGYNPPWTLPNMRRNEVLIPVESR